MKLREYDLFTRLIRTRPLMLAALMYLSGCILGYTLNFPPAACAALLLIPLIAAALLRRRSIAAVLILVAMLPMGMLFFNLSWAATQPFEDQRNVILSGRICEVPQWNAETERSICVLEDIHFNENAQKGKLRLYLRGDPVLLQQVELGQRITCVAHIWRANESTNPGQFNFSNYLRINGLRTYATAEIESASFSAPVTGIADRPKLLKTAIGRRIERLFPRNTAVAKAFLIGEKSGLSNEEREAYAKSGAAHLLAISGMHVSILAGVILWLLGRFLPRKYAFALTLTLLFAYGALIGFGSSLLRAILMFAIFGAAPLSGRYSDAPTRLAAALLVSLLLRPYAILESSFVLSYGATAGIILLYNPLLRLVHLDKFVEENTNVGLFSKSCRAYLSKIIASLAVTCAAQLAILPAVIHYFGAQPIWSFLVNLIAAPLAMLGYVLSIFSTLMNLAPLAAIADFLFGILTYAVSLFSRLPFASIKVAQFPVWLLILCSVVLFLSSDLSKLKPGLRCFLPLLVLIAIPISNICSYCNTLGCSVVFLDAGHADCAVIRSEGKVYLVDTGDSYTPAADYLSAMNYHVDGIFISHGHTDHAGGLSEILEVCTPDAIYISENWDAYAVDETVSLALDAAIAQGCTLEKLSSGREIQLSEKTLLRVLSPLAGFSANSANEDSLILHVSYGDCSAVFGGDAPTSVCYDKIGDIDLLKINHHGASDGLDARLLSELSPSVSVIPVGYNSYGHPSPSTLELLEAAGSHIYRTDQNGAITCRLKEDGSIVVRTYSASEGENGLE